MSQNSRSMFQSVTMKDANNNTLYYRGPAVQSCRGREHAPTQQLTSKVLFGNIAGINSMKIQSAETTGEREVRRPH